MAVIFAVLILLFLIALALAPRCCIWPPQRLLQIKQALAASQQAVFVFEISSATASNPRIDYERSRNVCRYRPDNMPPTYFPTA